MAYSSNIKAEAGASQPQGSGASTAPGVESYFESQIVRIKVGTDGSNKRTFMVHKDLIMAKLPYFEGCFRSGLKEDRENEVELEDEPGAFQEILRWVYTGTLGFPQKNDYKRIEGWINAYIMADRFCAETLKNDIVNVFRRFTAQEGMGEYGSITMIQANVLKVFRRGGLGDCPLRTFILKNIAWGIHCCGYEEIASKFDRGVGSFIRAGGEDVEDLFEELSRCSRPPPPQLRVYPPWWSDICDYHSHTTTAKGSCARQ